MSNVRVKTLYKDDRTLNDFLALKDIVLIDLKVRPMEYVVMYEQVKKTPKKVVKKPNVK
jgi:hypothetical protein